MRCRAVLDGYSRPKIGTQALIRRHHLEADGLELYYLFLPPRDSGYPTQEQVKKYREWFAQVRISLSPSDKFGK